MRDVTDVDLRSSILGGESALPFALAPTRYNRMMHPRRRGCGCPCGAGRGLMEFAAQQFDPSVSWDDLAWIRGLWKGPLKVKGLVSAADAARAVEVGVDAVVLSNHGGRQLDPVVVPLEMLPAIRDRVGDAIEVFVDSGIRRGSGIALALALGADAVLVGRPYLYGLGAAGGRGVAAAISMLGAELRRAMTLMGVTSVSQLRAEGQDLVRP